VPPRTFLVTTEPGMQGCTVPLSPTLLHSCAARVRPAAYHSKSHLAQVATWLVSVQPHQQREGQGGLANSLRGGSLLGRGAAEEAAPVPGSSPCTETLLGRWKAVGKGPSASRTAQGRQASGVGNEEGEGRVQVRAVRVRQVGPASGGPGEAGSQGVREVAFIGDSHLRFLLLHSAYLLTGTVDTSLLKVHKNFTVTLPIPPPPAPPLEGTEPSPAGPEQGASQVAPAPSRGRGRPNSRGQCFRAGAGAWGQAGHSQGEVRFTSDLGGGGV